MKFAIDTVQFNFVVVDRPWEELTSRPQVIRKYSTRKMEMKCWKMRFWTIVSVEESLRYGVRLSFPKVAHEIR